jgi:LysW-gamma-L-lysine carboxypeptidase
MLIEEQGLAQFFRDSPLTGIELDVPRDKSLPRNDVGDDTWQTATTPSDDIALLRSLLEISSLSGHETAAAAFLVDWMAGHGLDAFVDAVGNAVGILDGGPTADGSPPQEIVLLGHIDTVGGDVPVRVEGGKLYGRGAVDAKGPLAAFAAAAAQVTPPAGWRIVVIGAVEEEAATSKGARYAATQYQPTFCVIGEPSGRNRVTLGYKGRLLAYVALRQPMSHTAGPATSVCEQAVAFWNRVAGRVAEINTGRAKAWEQVLLSLRSFHSASDGLHETAQMMLGFRLPLDLGPEALKAVLREAAAFGASETYELELRFEGEEAAFRGDKNNALVRAFLAAIRSQGEQPGFVLKTGTSDMNVVGPVWQCPIVAYGPGDSALDHTPDEHVDIAEWQRGVSVLVGMLRQLLHPAPQPDLGLSLPAERLCRVS